MFKTNGKVIQCRAAVAWKTNTPLSIETIEVAPPRAGEVRIKITSTGVCHTDESILAGVCVQSQFPMILGHEGCGIVESVGEDVNSVQPGDHVVPFSVPQCKTCDHCLSKKSNWCQKIIKTQLQGLMPDGTARFTCKGKTLHHFFGCSTFSEYTVVAEIAVCKINPKAPLDKVCLLGCGITTGYGAAVNSAKVEKGSSCAIWGLGGVGLAVAMGCKIAGASRIIGIDLNPYKIETGKKFGVTDFINPKDCHTKSVEQILKEMTGGVDYTFECIGNINTMKAALDSAHTGWGVCVLIGVGSRKDDMQANPTQIVEGKTLKGSVLGNWKTRDDIPMLVEEYIQGKIMIDEFISHNLPLELINEAFNLMKDGKSIRTIIHMSNP